VPLFWRKTGLSGGRKLAVFLPFLAQIYGFCPEFWGFLLKFGCINLKFKAL
jgi:hypothetical protein